MPPETEDGIFHKPTRDLLIEYATHLRNAIDNPSKDGKHLVHTPSGEFRDTTIGVYRAAASICGELVALGDQAVVDRLFPQDEIVFRVSQVAPRDLSSGFSSPQAQDTLHQAE